MCVCEVRILAFIMDELRWSGWCAHTIIIIIWLFVLLQCDELLDVNTSGRSANVYSIDDLKCVEIHFSQFKGNKVIHHPFKFSYQFDLVFFASPKKKNAGARNNNADRPDLLGAASTCAAQIKSLNLNGKFSPFSRTESGPIQRSGHFLMTDDPSFFLFLHPVGTSASQPHRAERTTVRIRAEEHGRRVRILYFDMNSNRVYMYGASNIRTETHIVLCPEGAFGMFVLFLNHISGEIVVVDVVRSTFGQRSMMGIQDF